MVQGRVAGSRTRRDQALGQQLPAHPIQLADRGPTGSCAGKFFRVDGALTTQPMAPAVPPVRNTSA